MPTTTQPNAISRFLRQSIIFASVLIIFIAAASFAAAQSTDRDHPTPLKSAELRGRLTGGDTEYFYSFSAGPGELTVTLDVKASATNAGAEVELFDRNSRSLVSLLAQGIDSGSERKTETVRLTRRQIIVMRFKGIRYGSSGGQGNYLVRLEGAVEFAGETPTNEGNPADNRLGLPATGTLRIELEDGSAQEINLRRVKRIIVKP